MYVILIQKESNVTMQAIYDFFLGWTSFKYIAQSDIDFSFSFVRAKAISLKIKSLFGSYIGMAALFLLIFISAYNSYLSLV